MRLAIGLVVTLCCILGAMAVRDKLLGEPDLWWHIRTGAWIWQNKAFPTVDVFSYTYAGQPWIAKEWLSQLIYFAAQTLAGWRGVAFLGVASIGLSVAMLYAIVSAALRPSVAASVVLVCILLASPTITVRPHLLTLPLLVLWTQGVFSASSAGRAPSYLLLAALVVWANLHAAFTIGFVIAFFAFLDFLETTRLSKKGELVKWLAFLALCPAVTLIHPYSYEAMLATLTFVKSHEFVAPISEWQPFNAQKHVIHVAALLGLTFAAVTSGFRLSMARMALLMLLTYLFMTHVRYAFFLFPVLTLVVAPEVARQFPRLSFAAWRDEPRDPVEQRVSTYFRPVAAVLSAAIVISLGVQVLALPTQPPDRVAAPAAFDYIRSHGITGHVMNAYGFGGPLIFHGIPSFIDGRTDQLFIDGFMQQYAAGPNDAAGLAKALDHFDVRWTIMPPGDVRVPVLDALPGWKRVFADGSAVIHQRQ